MSYDEKGNAEHYKQNRIEVIDMMEKIWGTEATMFHCEMTAFKYRMRAGIKKDVSVEQDLLKASWYERKAKELFEKNELRKIRPCQDSISNG